MARQVYNSMAAPLRIPTKATAVQETDDEKLIISARTLNMISNGSGQDLKFPGNIAPEGYFYSPFYEIEVRELDDVLQSVQTRRINFDPLLASSEVNDFILYNVEMGFSYLSSVTEITVVSPVAYDFLVGQPFSVYDVLEEKTLRGKLESFEMNNGALELKIVLLSGEINNEDLRGLSERSNGKSRYIIAALNENAPDYAEYIPYNNKLVWRGPKKMSDLNSDSPLYDMPFTNGRLYIQRNVNVFLRRQDPFNKYRLFKNNESNPLNRFRVEGKKMLDFDYIKAITDSLIDAC